MDCGGKGVSKGKKVKKRGNEKMKMKKIRKRIFLMLWAMTMAMRYGDVKDGEILKSLWWHRSELNLTLCDVL